MKIARNSQPDKLAAKLVIELSVPKKRGNEYCRKIVANPRGAGKMTA